MRISNSIVLIVLVVLSLIACQRHVKSQVSSFSLLAPSTFGERYIFLPNQEQSKSAEYSQYASSISKLLRRRGWIRVSDPNQAKFVVLIDYGVAGSSTEVGSIPIYGQTGGGTTTHSGTVNTYGGASGTYRGTSYTMPSWGVVGTQTYSFTTYQRYFQMRIFDRQTEAPVYETKAASQGSSATFGAVAGCIFEMALANFPKSANSNASLPMDNCGD